MARARRSGEENTVMSQKADQKRNVHVPSPVATLESLKGRRVSQEIPLRAFFDEIRVEVETFFAVEKLVPAQHPAPIR